MKQNETNKIKLRHPLIFLTTLFFVFFVVKTIFIQISGEWDGFNLQLWAQNQRESTTVIKANRGTIYDRDQFALAQNLDVYRMFAVIDPDYSPNEESRLNHVKDVEKTAESLAKVIDLTSEEISEVITKGKEADLFQVEFGKSGSDLSRLQKQEIESFNLPGIFFKEEAMRYYPNGEFAAHVLGVAQPNDEQVVEGIAGIEAQLETELKGIDGSVTVQQDKYRDPVATKDASVMPKQDGYDVSLTIDQKIQTILEDALTVVNEKYDPERITATVIDPKTGEIIAMGQRPGYNPNDLGNVENWFNDVVSTPIEPGSTMKIFTIAAAIEEGVYDRNALYQSGRYKIPQITRAVPDYRTHWGTISYAEGFQRSSNVLMSKLVWEKIGTERYLDYLKAFQFDQLTGIDLPRERIGQFVYRYPIEQLNASFGQGTTITPIQLLKGATAIANEGKMMKPYVIKSITDPNTGEIITENKPEIVGEPISKETAKQVLMEMEDVVTEKTGTANGVYKLPSYSLAGKTGTAQISGGASGYLSGRENYIFSFIGMAPSEDPELMMYVTVKQPKLKPTETGSQPVSYIFNYVMENALHYSNINPDAGEENDVRRVEMPDYQKQSVSELREKLESNGTKVTIVGEGETINATNKKPGELVLSTEHVLIITDQPVMPDLRGWSYREATHLAELLQLDREIVGRGHLVKQSIKPGSAIKSGDYLLLDFTTFETKEDVQE